eukprot:Gb_25770 [translate_table: standard]
MGVVTHQGVSKWQSKGKRNMRTQNKKHYESSNGKNFLKTNDACTSLVHGIAFEDKVHSSEELRTKKVSNNTYEEPVSSKKGEQQLNHFLFPDVLLRDGSRERNVQVFYDGQHLRQVNSLPRTEAEGEHVLLVSLMSRLNGKAIVGHPVTVETLEYGYCDALFDDYNFISEPFVNYQSTGVVKIGQLMQLDGGYCCASCGTVNGLIGCWRKQLNLANDAQRVDMCISLSQRLLNGTCQFKDLHDIVVKATRKLEEEVGPINGVLSKMAQGISSRLSTGLNV